MIVQDEFQRVVRRARRRPLWEPQGELPVELSRADIQRMIPHRPPMLLVDAIDAVDLEQQTLRATRTIDADDLAFAGHFPGNPVYPGALLVESMGQAALCLHHLLENQRVAVHADDVAQPVRLLKVHHAVFLEPCLPGDRLEILCRRLESDGLCMVCATQVMRGPVIAALAILEVYLVED